jgi:hypothetical protein
LDRAQEGESRKVSAIANDPMSISQARIFSFLAGPFSTRAHFGEFRLVARRRSYHGFQSAHFQHLGILSHGVQSNGRDSMQGVWVYRLHFFFPQILDTTIMFPLIAISMLFGYEMPLHYFHSTRDGAVIWRVPTFVP